MKSKLIIISGPTASGKTKTSIEVAKLIQNELKLPASIVNFDSLLFYKELSIGTAKPSMEEREGIEHHLIDIASIKSPMNASNFIAECEIVIKDLLLKGKIVILVGGSAFYLRALLKGMYESPSSSKNIKAEIEAQYKSDGITPFVEFLKINDSQSLINHHENDHYRIMRAVEYFQTNGSKISDKKKELDELNPYDFSTIIHPWEILHLYLDLPKDQHYEIIQKRVGQMFAQGWIEEIENLEKNGYSLDEKPLTSIGYIDIITLKRNGATEIAQQCTERIAISTRQLAKSQRTFFNRITPKESFNPIHDQAKIRTRVEEFIKDLK